MQGWQQAGRSELVWRMVCRGPCRWRIVVLYCLTLPLPSWMVNIGSIGDFLQYFSLGEQVVITELNFKFLHCGNSNPVL